jgi:hypothetical protein
MDTRVRLLFPLLLFIGCGGSAVTSDDAPRPVARLDPPAVRPIDPPPRPPSRLDPSNGVRECGERRTFVIPTGNSIVLVVPACATEIVLELDAPVGGAAVLTADPAWSSGSYGAGAPSRNTVAVDGAASVRVVNAGREVLDGAVSFR